MSWQFHPKIECDYFEERVGVWKDIVRSVSNPKKYLEKPLIPLWSFYGLIGKSDREMAKDGRHWRSCGANMETLNAFQIDYDDGLMTIDEFVEAHWGLVYALYTSPSHTAEKQKFRVIIPFEKPLLNAYLMRGKVRDYFLEMFPHCDKTTINTFRKQRMPAMPMSGDAYRFHIEDGNRFQIDLAEVVCLSALTESLDSTVEEIDLSQELDPFDSPIGQFDNVKELQRLMAKYAEELSIMLTTERGNGSVHYSLTRQCSALSKSGMSQSAMAEYFESHGFSGTEINRLILWATGNK